MIKNEDIIPKVLTDKITQRKNGITYIVPKKVIERSKKILDEEPYYTGIALFEKKTKNKLKKVM